MSIKVANGDCAVDSGVRDHCFGTQLQRVVSYHDVVKLLREAVQLHVRDAIINVLIHKYNVGDVILAETLPPNFTPLCIIYASKTNLFCEELVKRGIKPQT